MDDFEEKTIKALQNINVPKIDVDSNFLYKKHERNRKKLIRQKTISICVMAILLVIILPASAIAAKAVGEVIHKTVNGWYFGNIDNENIIFDDETDTITIIRDDTNEIGNTNNGNVSESSEFLFYSWEDLKKSYENSYLYFNPYADIAPDSMSIRIEADGNKIKFEYIYYKYNDKVVWLTLYDIQDNGSFVETGYNGDVISSEHYTSSRGYEVLLEEVERDTTKSIEVAFSSEKYIVSLSLTGCDISTAKEIVNQIDLSDMED